jgi:hypothetical protein
MILSVMNQAIAAIIQETTSANVQITADEDCRLLLVGDATETAQLI